MSAQRLRDAAKVLREAAEGATHGGWQTVGEARTAIAPTPYSSVIIAGADNAANAAYIATMSPPVALALADWLDAAAKADDFWMTYGDTQMTPVLDPDAHVVADAILGTAA